MKKLLCAFVASFSLIQSAQAITSELNQSINIYQTILSSGNIQAAIPQNEFIVDIKKNRFRSSEFRNRIRYLITTVTSNNTLVGEVEDFENELLNEMDVNCHHSGSHHHHHHSHSHSHSHSHQTTHTYEVIVSVTPNPAIGPPIVTVVRITPVSTSTNVFYGNEVN